MDVIDVAKRLHNDPEIGGDSLSDLIDQLRHRSEDELRAALMATLSSFRPLSPQERLVLRARKLPERRAARCNLREFVEGAISGDVERMLGADLDRLDYDDEYQAGWPAAWRAIARHGSVPDRTSKAFLRLYISSGDHIRSYSAAPGKDDNSGDIVLIKALRVLLPPYNGGSLSLYRGQNALQPRSRSYGLSWSSTRAVAESHAQGPWQASEGGSIVLETLAPPEAIISRVSPGE